tara:strand:- start:949 stop:1761 length:813 start_codon:yes stop_codon:yes gene_type:complete
VVARFGFWKNKTHHLDKMTLKELVVAYFQYYAIQGYIIAALISIYVAATHVTSLWANVAAVAITYVVYPLVWYLAHRYILHGNIFYKNPITARTWKRVHYDHHQDPYDLSILFGALYTTMPLIALATIPVGYLLDGIGGAATAFATGLIITCFYEFCHCIMHLSYKPKNEYVKKIKKLHVMHHFQNEKVNYGIMSFWLDKLFGTYQDNPAELEKSPTVFDLGYTAEMAEKYPWVARMSGGVSHNSPRERRLKHTSKDKKTATEHTQTAAE